MKSRPLRLRGFVIEIMVLFSCLSGCATNREPPAQGMSREGLIFFYPRQYLWSLPAYERERLEREGWLNLPPPERERLDRELEGYP